MRRAATRTALLVLLSTCGLLAQVRNLVGVTFRARIVSVVDGDTVDAIPAGETRPIRIRLEGVDTPERGQPWSKEATPRSRRWCRGGKCRSSRSSRTGTTE